MCFTWFLLFHFDLVLLVYLFLLCYFVSLVCFLLSFGLLFTGFTSLFFTCLLLLFYISLLFTSGALAPNIYFYFFIVLLLSLWLQKLTFFALGSLAAHVLFPVFFSLFTSVSFAPELYPFTFGLLAP